MSKEGSAISAIVRSAPAELRHEHVAELLARTVEVADTDAAALDDVLADLAELRLPRGSVVIIALSNGRHMLTQYFAAILSGLVPLAVTAATPAARLLELARRMGAHGVLGAVLDPRRYGATTTYPVGGQQIVLLEPARQPGGPRFRAGEVLMLTSGTSGMFTACLHEVSSLLRNAHRHAEAIGLRADDTVLVNLPLYYSYAIVAQACAALVTGARLILSGPPFAPASYLAAIDRYDVTSSSITPTIARRLLAQDQALPQRLRMLTVGGDRLSAAEVGGLLRARPAAELYVTYGLTEAGPRVTTLAAHREPAGRHASVGRPLRGVRTHLSLVDCGEDGVGELLVESDTALIRKVGPSARQVLLAPGLVATGDRFGVDDDGYHFFHGRLSEFVVIQGEKVALASVRQAALDIPGVLGCRPRMETDRRGNACFDLEVQVIDPERVTSQVIRERLNGVLLRSEQPRDIVVLAADAAFRK